MLLDLCENTSLFLVVHEFNQEFNSIPIDAQIID